MATGPDDQLDIAKPRGSTSNLFTLLKLFSHFTDHTGWGARFTFALLAFFGNALCYVVRVDMSVTIVAMVNRSSLHWYIRIVS